MLRSLVPLKMIMVSADAVVENAGGVGIVFPVFVESFAVVGLSLLPGFFAEIEAGGIEIDKGDFVFFVDEDIGIFEISVNEAEIGHGLKS